VNNELSSEGIHIWYYCHHCEVRPIVGKRFHCKTCPDGPDNDLCEECFEKYQGDPSIHPIEGSPGSMIENKDHEFEMLEGKPAGLYESWLSVVHPEVPAPFVPDRFVVRPLFTSGPDSVIGGYAFAAFHENHERPLLLTGLHVMDEMIKEKGIDSTAVNKGYTGRELPAVITEVGMYDVFAPNWMLAPLGSAGPMLVLPEARTDEEEPYSDRDIAAFRIHDAKELNPVPLAPCPPVVGDAVWQVAQLPKRKGKRLFKAVVVEITDRSMIYKYENREERLKYTSGSPIIDRSGSIVGINVGGGEFGGEKIGHANHVGNIRRHLEKVQ
jgi:hypothetical protein